MVPRNTAVLRPQQVLIGPGVYETAVVLSYVPTGGSFQRHSCTYDMQHDLPLPAVLHPFYKKKKSSPCLCVALPISFGEKTLSQAERMSL